jgi:anti-sigma B factor antagonist
VVDSRPYQDRGVEMRDVVAWSPIDSARFVVHDHGTARTIEVVGELDIAVAGELGGLLDEALVECGPVVVDLSRAEFIDSAGVHLLVRMHQKAAERSVGLTFIRAPRAVQRVFELCGVEAVLPFEALSGTGRAGMGGDC